MLAHILLASYCQLSHNVFSISLFYQFEALSHNKRAVKSCAPNQRNMAWSNLCFRKLKYLTRLCLFGAGVYTTSFTTPPPRLRHFSVNYPTSVIMRVCLPAKRPTTTRYTWHGRLYVSPLEILFRATSSTHSKRKPILPYHALFRVDKCSKCTSLPKQTTSFEHSKCLSQTFICHDD